MMCGINIWPIGTLMNLRRRVKKKRKAGASQKGGLLHTGGSMNFAGHRRRLQKLNGGEVVPLFEVFEETHEKKKEEEDSTGESWVEPRAKKRYEGFQKSLEHWRQTQPASEDGTAIRPSPVDMTSIWTQVAGGLSKGRVYGLGVLCSSSSPSPLLSNASTIQCFYFTKYGRNGSDAKANCGAEAKV
ncbi:uncharacterized protein LOC132602443 [Lycium barbarum]|uniref:uncharacterized protein LOC132602443 n=1 Tax=Lycium barbarum TaxID=112863 RepID=UPI00293E17D5|nr:uncharacterized protein LOC132602443 [Lycium barbarum]